MKFKILLLGGIITLFGLFNYSSAITLTCDSSSCSPFSITLNESSWESVIGNFSFSNVFQDSDVNCIISDGSEDYNAVYFSQGFQDEVDYDCTQEFIQSCISNVCGEYEEGSDEFMNCEGENMYDCDQEAQNNCLQLVPSTPYYSSDGEPVGTFTCTPYLNGNNPTFTAVLNISSDEGGNEGGSEGGNEGSVIVGGFGSLTPAISGLWESVSQIIPLVVYIGIGVLLAIIGFIAIRWLLNRLNGKINGYFSSKRG